jgi:hypothetical protein
MNTNNFDGLPELEIVIMAQNGDKNAAELLWLRYRKIMINVLWGISSMSVQEKESEAAAVFMHYLKDLFNQEKVRKPPEEWRFFSMLYQGMLNRRMRIRSERIYFSYDESDDGYDSESQAINAEKVCLFNKELFSRYNPEDDVLELDFKEKAKQIGDSIDRLQKIRMGYASYVQNLFGGDSQ